MREPGDFLNDLDYRAPTEGAAGNSFSERLGGEAGEVEGTVPVGEISLRSTEASEAKAKRPTGMAPLALPSFALEDAAGWSESFGGQEEVAPVEEVKSSRAIEVPEDDGLRPVALPDFEDTSGGTWLSALEDEIDEMPSIGAGASTASRPAAAPTARAPQAAGSSAPPASGAGPSTTSRPARPAARPQGAAPSVSSSPRPAPSPAAAAQGEAARRPARSASRAAPSAPFTDDSIPCLGMSLKDIMKLPLNSGHGMVIAQIDGMTSVAEIEDIMAWFGPGRARKLLDELILLGVAALKS